MQRVFPAVVLAGILSLSAGCGRHLQPLLQPNQPPSVRFLPTRVVADLPRGRTYSVSWQGEDLDGHVDHFLVALDPAQAAQAGSGWTQTTAGTQLLTLTTPDDASRRTPHRFVVCAVDDRGARSAPATLQLAADNIPPTVQITCPSPGGYATFVPEAVRIEWDGTDPDGATGKPAQYKFILLSPFTEFKADLAYVNPDSLRRYYANHPAGPWAGWDSTSAESTHAVFTNIPPGQTYVFAVVAFDEAGDYSPAFDFRTNMLELRSGPPDALGPEFTVLAESFQYRYRDGGYSDDPSRHVPLQVPSETVVPIDWFADRPYGNCATIRYRWVLDPASLDDPTPRSDEATDVHHWSAWSPTTTSANLGPFGSGYPPKREVHRLYIAADDGLARSLAIVDLIVVPRQFVKDLLIVDDTRLRVDMEVNGVLEPPSGAWPTAAELDTFLFARGGVEWRSYPPRTLSPPGVFNGYSYDTLGTRGLGSVPLSTLAQYRHVIWYVDGAGAQLTHSITDPVAPMTLLRYMGLPGNANTLVPYLQLGGKLWLAGGGAANAVSDGFNDPSNDRPPINQTKTYSHFSSTRHELDAGRFMYDWAKWQSEFRILQIDGTVSGAPYYNGVHKSPGRFTDTPKYAELPDALEPKSPVTDPLVIEAPTRTAADFYQTRMFIEFLQVENHIIEDVDPDPGVEDEQSTLDTLYRVASAAAQIPDFDDPFDPYHRDLRRQPRYPIMTYYHGPKPIGASVIHSGFPFWLFQRSECTKLVDFVQHDLWGLNRVAASPAPAAGGEARIHPARRVTPATRAPLAQDLPHTSVWMLR